MEPVRVAPLATAPELLTESVTYDVPVTVLAIAWTDIALSALAYHNNVGATVRARSIVEPWTISAVAYLWSYWSLRDGLIIAYVASMVAALVAALIPLRNFSWPSVAQARDALDAGDSDAPATALADALARVAGDPWAMPE